MVENLYDQRVSLWIVQLLNSQVHNWSLRVNFRFQELLADVELERFRFEELVANFILRQRHVILPQEIVVNSSKIHQVFAFVKQGVQIAAAAREMIIKSAKFINNFWQNYVKFNLIFSLEINPKRSTRSKQKQSLNCILTP